MKRLSALGALALVAPKEVQPTGDVVGFAPPEASESSVVPPSLAPEGAVLKSELPTVSHEAWTRFVFALKRAPRNAVSTSNRLGMFELRYKRLADLHLVEHLRYKRGVGNVQEADWRQPLTLDGFLHSAEAQYQIFVASVCAYFRELATGQVKVPEGMTVSGALAVLHRGGHGALTKWGTEQFPETAEIFRRCNGVF